MTKTFFGGDHSMSHFTCHLSIGTYPLRSQERKDAYAKIREAFGREQYFQYKNGDAKGKEKARKHCENLAAAILERTGVTVEISEGFFL
jgi:hypothetical protein